MADRRTGFNGNGCNRSRHSRPPPAQEQGGQEAAQPTAPELSEEEIDSIVNEMLKENPAFAGIPEEERARLIAEVLDELRAG